MTRYRIMGGLRGGLAVLLLAGCAPSAPPPRRATPAPARTRPAPPPRRATPTGPAVMVTPEGHLQVPGEFSFASGTNGFAPGGQHEVLLKALLRYLEAHPRITQIRVEGHTDSRGLASRNARLSGARALAVKTWLLEHAVAAKRVVAVGCGEIKPLDTNRTPEGRARNRRLTILITERDGKPYRGRDANGGCTPF